MKSARGPTATYLYCLMQAQEPPSLAAVPPGLPGLGAARLLEAGNSLWLVAADAPLSLYSKSAIEAGLQNLAWVADCAIAHERVVEFFARAGTVIPLKLFTLFSTDQRSLAHIQETRKQLDSVIERVAGRQEWGIRILANEASSAGPLPGKGKPKETKVSGTQFLLLRKKAQDQARLQKVRVLEEAETAYRELSRYGEDARRHPAGQVEAGRRIILDAAFLVPVEKEKRFQSAVKRVTSRGARAYVVTLTGPWPPYNFVGNVQ